MSDGLVNGLVKIMGTVQMRGRSMVQAGLLSEMRFSSAKRLRTSSIAAIVVMVLCMTGVGLHAQEQSARPPAPGIAERQSGAPKVMVEPDSINFMPMPAGSISPSQLLKVTNTGNAPLNVTDLQLTGINLPEFAFASSCVLPVAPGASCIVNVTFSPLVEGAHQAKVLINDDAMDSPQMVTLSGEASDPFMLSVTGAGSASMSAGQAAQYSLKVSTAPGFLGVVQVKCSGAPLGIVCAPTPAAVSQPGGGATNMDLPIVLKVSAAAGPGGNSSAPAAIAPGTYALTLSANWGLITKKVPLMLMVQ